MEQSLIDATERYAETIRNTDVYKTYQGQLFLIRQNPEKYQRVNEFRRKTMNFSRVMAEIWMRGSKLWQRNWKGSGKIRW